MAETAVASVDATTEQPVRSRDERGARSDISARLSLAVFLAAVVVVLPLIVLRLGDYHWFLRDDWMFLTAADHTGLGDLFEPHNAHFMVVPRAAYVVLWRLFGATSYVPYQAAVVVLHLAVVVLVRVIMRRAGVGPWLATAAAGSLLLFGPGVESLVWGFLIANNASIAFGLAAIVAADRDGPLGWRDAGAVGLAQLALMSSGMSLPLVVALGAVALLRRGWKVAVALIGPLAVGYLAWTLIERPQTEAPWGRPSPRVVAEWVWSAMVGTFDGLGHWRLVSWLLVAVLVTGLALAWAPWTGEGGVRRRLALPSNLVAPVALLGSGVALSVFTAWGRWYGGPDAARAPRYVYMLAAVMLPALAVAAQALVARRRVLVAPLCVLFLVAVPHNASLSEFTAFGEGYMAGRERIVTTAVRMPFADDVPRDVRPEPDAYDGGLSIGFLLDAADAGKIEPSTFPLTERDKNEFRIRLGVAQRTAEAFPSACETGTDPVVLTPAVGDRVVIGSPVVLTTADERGRPTSPPVLRRPPEGRELTVELPDLRLRVAGAPGSASFTLCTP